MEEKTDSQLIDQIMRDQSSMENEREPWNKHWQEVAERVLPRGVDFIADTRNGQKKTEKAIDSTPILACERFAAAVESVTIPRTQTWHGLQNERFAGDNEVQQYFEAVTRILFRIRYAPVANFANQMSESFISLGAFGNSCVFVDELPGKGTRYITYHMREIYFSENYQGVIDLIHRKFKLTARQAVQQFGIDALPETIKLAADKSPMSKFEFIHRVGPNDNVQTGKKDETGMPWSSIYISKEGRKIVRNSGYWTMPYCPARYYKSAGEVYGRGPGMTALPDIKMLNEMNRETLTGAQLANRPPILLADDGVLQSFSMQPASLNFGGINSQGQEMAKPFNTGAQPQLGQEVMEQKRTIINDIFLVTLFQILVQNPQMTATEAMLRAQEKGQLLAPTMGRVMSEQLGPMIEREIDIIGRMGLLPLAPQQLIDANAEYDIEFKSPLIRMQMSDEGSGIAQTLAFVGQIAQYDPTAIKLIRTGETVRKFADINGMPLSLIVTAEEEAQQQQAAAQQQQLNNVLQTAPNLAASAKDLAQANQIANTPLPAPQQ